MEPYAYPDWSQSIDSSFNVMLTNLVDHVPQILTALAVLIIGYVIANALKQLVMKVTRELKLDAALDKAGVDTVTERAGYRLDSGRFLGMLVKWFVMIVAFIAALDILNLDQATAFLSSVLAYLPQVIVSVIMLVVGMIVAGFVRNLVVAGGRATRFGSSQLLGQMAYTAIVVFTVLAALNQLGIADELVQTLFAGLVFGGALAFGLAFGLGGKDVAGEYLRSVVRRQM